MIWIKMGGFGPDGGRIAAVARAHPMERAIDWHKRTSWRPVTRGQEDFT